VPEEVRRWIESCAGDGMRVAATRRLSGGVVNLTHEVTLEAPSGARRRLILRRRAPWSGPAPGTLAREAATLSHVAAPPGLPVPEVVSHAAEVDGAEALLMTKLGGRMDLAPRRPERWLQQQAEALVAIHDLPPVPDGEGQEAVDLSDREPPAWSAHPHLWATALDALAAGRGEGSSGVGFIHGDFQHFNLLWSRGTLSGIVDWSGHNLAHPDRDTGHCRLNLVILYGSEWAEDLRRRYEAVAGRAVDPWWDLLETCAFLPTWAPFIPYQVGGRIPFDIDAMHRRVDAHLPLLLDRLGV
jgi:aminoglycoside phosphotransferase (APT) family kinase protein